MVPTAKGALLALTASIHCEAVLDEVFLVQKPYHGQGGSITEAGPWGPPDPYTLKIYGDLAGGQDEISQNSNSLTYSSFAFVAGEWDDCCGGTKTRDVECKNVFTANVVPESDCDPATKPPNATSCTGGPPGCAAPSIKSGLNFKAADYASWTITELPACYAWPYSAHESLAGPGMEQWPLMCQGWAHYDTPCHAGLPFGAFTKPDGSSMDPAYCGAKCVAMGLDAFGIEHGTKCRCGPLAVNLNVWGDSAVRNELVMRPDHLKVYTQNASVCPLKVYHYTGPYENEGIPHSLQLEDLEVEAYFQRVFNNEVILADNEEGGHDFEYENTDLPVGNPEDRSCYPSECTAGKLWIQNGSRVADGTIWAEKTIVPIVLDEMLDQSRKDVLIDAIAEIGSKTCVDFKDVTGNIPPGKFLAVVGPASDADAHHCYTKGLGMPPPYVPHAYFEMGTCNNAEHIGNVLHILLEVLGIGPEQMRPDALLEFNGKGPFIYSVDYGMASLEARFNSGTQSKFAPIATSFMGSGGNYKPFDYESVMMTSNVHKFLFGVPVAVANEVGQRHGLSDGDVAMINEIYGCVPLTKKKSEFKKLDPAVEEEIRLNADRNHEKNVKDLEKAEKFQPDAAKKAKELLERASK